MQRLSGESQAADRAGRLFRTVQESIGNMSPEERLRTIRQMSGIMSAAATQELRQLSEANDLRGQPTRGGESNLHRNRLLAAQQPLDFSLKLLE